MQEVSNVWLLHRQCRSLYYKYENIHYKLAVYVFIVCIHHELASELVLHSIGFDVWKLIDSISLCRKQPSLTMKIHTLHGYRKFQMFDSFVTKQVFCFTIVQICITNQLFIYLLSVSIMSKWVGYSRYGFESMMVIKLYFIVSKTTITYNQDPQKMLYFSSPKSFPSLSFFKSFRSKSFPVQSLWFLKVPKICLTCRSVTPARWG